MAIDKILYFTDVHYGTQPVNRKDDFNEAMLFKLAQLLQFAEENGCIVVMGGDIFDSAKIPFIPLIKLIKVFRKYKVEIYSLIGNHDGKAGQSPLELIDSVKVIHLPKYTVDLNNCRIVFDHFPSMEYETREALMDNSKYNILAIHENITKDPFIGEHVLMSEFKTGANMVLVSHYHPEQGNIKRKDGKLFISPGALARRKRIEHEMDRTPGATFITVDEDHTVKVKTIRVKCETDIWKEKTFFDVIDDSSVYRTEISNMKDILSNDFKTISIEDMMTVFAKETKTDSSVVEHCLQEIRNV